LEPRASRDATDQDARHRYHYYLTPTGGSEGAFKEPSLQELARVIKAGACIELTFRTLFYISAAIFAEPPVERRVSAISRLF
jgi:hypothetical protein